MMPPEWRAKKLYKKAATTPKIKPNAANTSGTSKNPPIPSRGPQPETSLINSPITNMTKPTINPTIKPIKADHKAITLPRETGLIRFSSY